MLLNSQPVHRLETVNSICGVAYRDKIARRLSSHVTVDLSRSQHILDTPAIRHQFKTSCSCHRNLVECYCPSCTWQQLSVSDERALFCVSGSGKPLELLRANRSRVSAALSPRTSMVFLLTTSSTIAF